MNTSRKYARGRAAVGQVGNHRGSATVAKRYWMDVGHRSLLGHKLRTYRSRRPSGAAERRLAGVDICSSCSHQPLMRPASLTSITML